MVAVRYSETSYETLQGVRKLRDDHNFLNLEYQAHRNVDIYRVRQKNLTILQNSCEWNRWRGEFVFERPSSETRSISVAMERWSVELQAFAVKTYLKKTILL
jgi:hypothetical protein